MKQLALGVVIAAFLINTANSQNKTYFGLEFLMAQDINEINDNGNYLMNSCYLEPQGGINIRQEINRKLFVEAGAIVKLYWEGFGFKPSPVLVNVTDPNVAFSHLSWVIPVRLGLNLNIYKQKIYFVPVIGYSYGIHPPTGYGTMSDTLRSFGARATTIRYTATENPNVSRHFSLLQTGIGFEYEMFNALLFSISGNYYKGYTPIWVMDIDYTIDNSDPMTGTVTSKGGFWCVSTGVKYSISNIWTAKR